MNICGRDEKSIFKKMFDLFFSCSNLPALCSDRAVELSGSFRARRQFKTLSHSLCQILSTSIKPFMSQFRLNNYAGVIWHIIINSKHTQENFNLFTDFTIYKQNKKVTVLIHFFFILNYLMCSVYNQHQYDLSKPKLFLVNSQIHFSHLFFQFFVSVVFA